MPSKKKKYNARFPAGRIKKIMQTDEEVGKVAQAVPIIISRTLELFVESLLIKSAQITQARNAKTLTPSHMKQCILSENRFDFLKDLVKNIPDATTQEDAEMSAALELSDYAGGTASETETPLNTTPTATTFENLLTSTTSDTKLCFTPNFYTEQATSSTGTVIQYGTISKLGVENSAPQKIDFSIKSLVQKDARSELESESESEPKSKIHIDLTNIIRQPCNDVPPLIPLAHTNLYGQGNNDNLCIDEDYDN